MMVSTKGRYALRVMTNLAGKDSKAYTPLKELADDESLSQKYLESIMTILSKGGLVDAVHGKGGGYKLNRPAEDYSVGDILRLTEGSVAPVACLTGDKNNCENAAKCLTLPMWQELNDLINNFFDTYTLAKLASKE